MDEKLAQMKYDLNFKTIKKKKLKQNIFTKILSFFLFLKKMKTTN